MIHIIDSGKRRKDFKNDGEKKAWWLSELATGVEFVRSLIDHKKVLVLAMNGPGVGAGASWFQGTSDIFYAAQDAWMQVTFSQLGLIPEMGAAVNWAQSIGVHRANDWLMFGGKATADEMHKMGLVNRVFPTEGFHSKVQDYLTEMLKERSGKSMMEMKRLQNQSLRDQRILALFEAWQALAERFVDGEPAERMLAKMNELAGMYIFWILAFSRKTHKWLTLIQQSERRSRPSCRICRSCMYIYVRAASISPRCVCNKPRSWHPS